MNAREAQMFKALKECVGELYRRDLIDGVVGNVWLSGMAKLVYKLEKRYKEDARNKGNE